MAKNAPSATRAAAITAIATALWSAPYWISPRLQVRNSSGALSSFLSILDLGMERRDPTRPRRPDRTKSHLVLEVLGGHLLEDLAPLVSRDVREVLVLPFLRLLEDARALEDLLGDVDGALGAQREGDRV